MSSALIKTKGNYKKWMTLSTGSVPIAADFKSDGADRRLMSHFISPFILVLRKGNISLHDFVKIWKKYKISRETQQKIIIEEQFQIQVNDIISSTRELNHTNAQEKNIIFTYHAFSDPEGLKIFLYNYILNNILNTCNKKDLYFEIIKEVDDVQKEFNQSKGNLTQCKFFDQSSNQTSLSTSSFSSSPSSNVLSSPNQTPQQIELTTSSNHTLAVLDENIIPHDKDCFDDASTNHIQTDFCFNEPDDFDSFDLNFSYQFDNHDTFF